MIRYLRYLVDFLSLSAVIVCGLAVFGVMSVWSFVTRTPMWETPKSRNRVSRGGYYDHP